MLKHLLYSTLEIRPETFLVRIFTTTGLCFWRNYLERGLLDYSLLENFALVNCEIVLLHTEISTNFGHFISRLGVLGVLSVWVIVSIVDRCL